MFILRFTQYSDSQPDYYQIEVALEGSELKQTATVSLRFKLTPQEQENLRWYLEDYLQFPFDPAPQIAAKIEQRMLEIGRDLFKTVFQANDDACALWSSISQNLSCTRVEIITDVAHATVIPWELMCDDSTNTPIALQVSAFVHLPQGTSQTTRTSYISDSKIRILLVVCRPQGQNDVPFRSVATRLLKGLTNQPDIAFQLEVLRPPTFDRLIQVLYAAKGGNTSYHIVHFDGHGVYIDAIAETSGAPPDPRKLRGYLVFENPNDKDNLDLIHGEMLGQVLVDTDVSFLVLNACRSAHAEIQESPIQLEDMDARQRPYSHVRALGSFAQEVVNAGVAGVVAMRYNVYVVTAAQFVADLYASLVQGQTLGEAVTEGQKQLKAQPERESPYQPIDLEDWLVPVVYEVAPISLFPKPVSLSRPTITLHTNDILPTTEMLDGQLPNTPDVGFFGRDETLLEIDRAFDRKNVVLISGFAGSGKTSLAAEFARWYALTGGLQGKVLFASFERYLPLARVLDKIGQQFRGILGQLGFDWNAPANCTTQQEIEQARKSIVLTILQQNSVLWIWDNVEPISGFPDSETRRWSQEEQQELVDFLRVAKDTGAKFLLTSRRDEQYWLGDLPERIAVLPMQVPDRVQFAKALSKKYNRSLTGTDLKDWHPLLEYTQGNPLTITVVVGQALQQGLKTRKEIETFVANIRLGEADLEDNESEGRSKSLGASLSYGFTHAFTEEERHQLALLYLFQGSVDALLFQLMGAPESEWCLPVMQAVTTKQIISLFNRATDVGILARTKGGYINSAEGYYTIHPALPWYFKRLFDQYYPSSIPSSNLISSVRAVYAYVNIMAQFAALFQDQYERGNSKYAIPALRQHEANLIHAKLLAYVHQWWKLLLGITLGLKTLYWSTARNEEWVRLLDDIIPCFVNPSDDRALFGREDGWSIVTEFRVELAMKRRQLSDAERLQRILESWWRESTKEALSLPQENLDENQRYEIRTLAVTLERLGNILRDQGKADCIKVYEEVIQLSRHLNDKTEAANAAYNLGKIYVIQHNWEKAEYWFKQSLIREDFDVMRKSESLQELGCISYNRYLEVSTNHKSVVEPSSYLMDATNFFNEALKLLPNDANDHLSNIHNQLGIACRLQGNYNQAFSHFQEGIRHGEIANSNSCLGSCKYNIAAMFFQNTDRLDDALLYAQSALEHFYNSGTETDIQMTSNLIQMILGQMVKLNNSSITYVDLTDEG